MKIGPKDWRDESIQKQSLAVLTRPTRSGQGDPAEALQGQGNLDSDHLVQPEKGEGEKTAAVLNRPSAANLETEIAKTTDVPSESRPPLSIELSPALAIPLKNFLEFGDEEKNFAMENGLGFSLGLAMMFNEMEFRYSYTRLSTGKVRGQIPDDIADSLRQTVQEAIGKTIPKQVALDVPGALEFHHITLGFRPTFTPSRRIRCDLPLAMGFLISSVPDYGVAKHTLMGLGASLGLSLEYVIERTVVLGTNLRFSIYFTEPEPYIAGAGINATGKSTGNVIAWLPMLAVGIQARLFR